jgi:hypothetical protein
MYRIRLTVFYELRPVICGFTVHKPVDKMVDNHRWLRITAQILWIFCGQEKYQINPRGALAPGRAEGVEILLPPETGTIREATPGT